MKAARRLSAGRSITTDDRLVMTDYTNVSPPIFIPRMSPVKTESLGLPGELLDEQRASQSAFALCTAQPILYSHDCKGEGEGTSCDGQLKCPLRL